MGSIDDLPKTRLIMRSVYWSSFKRCAGPASIATSSYVDPRSIRISVQMSVEVYSE
jgi:hypothetical protein